MAKQLPKRSEIPVERTWNLEALFATDDQWEVEFQKVKAELPELSKYKGRLAESADTLYEALQTIEKLQLRAEHLYVYAHLRYDQDTTNSFYQGIHDRARALLAQFGQTVAYVTPELLTIPEETIQSFLQEKDELKLYTHYFDKLNRRRPHVLSEKEEALLAQASEVLNAPSQTFGMLNNADLKFPIIKDEEGHDVELTHGRYISFLESSDRRVRQDAFHAMYDTYGKFKNTFASTLSAQVKRNVFLARVRNYRSAREAALSRNDIPEAVYDQLVETVNKHLPLMHRYVALRKKALGLNELHMYDLYTPLVPDSKIVVTYEEAQELVLQGLNPLGEEYVNTIRQGFNDRWIDVEENVGKRSGAYSSGAYGTMPYILLNWQNNLDNAFTLAHELGHSMHTYYSSKTHPYTYADYPIFLAEVASTLNEALLNDYLLKTTTDKKQKLYILNHFLEGFRGTVFRQTMFAEFEHAIHQKVEQGEALTAEVLTAIYYDLNKKYFGDEIIVDEPIGLEWARIPHFYYNFYVYQYATGYSAAAALAKQILEEGAPAAKRYIEKFLKAGSSDYPINVLKAAGVDMTTPKPIEQACQLFEEALNQMERLLNDI